MKSNIITAAILIGLFTVSCRKERTCECKVTETHVRTGNNPSTKVENSSTTYTKLKQKKGEFRIQTDCFSTVGTDTHSGGVDGSSFVVETTTERKCELK